jgi:MAPEG family protein
MAGFTRTQAGVALGMAGGVALTVAAFLWPDLPAVRPEDRLPLWLACALFVSAWLLVSVGRLAGHRFFTPADIDGGGLSDGTPQAKLLQTLIQNTLEQVVLAVPAYGAWLWLAPEGRHGLVIICAACFAIGRLLFFAGYSRGAPFRALGFTLTFYPTVGLYLLLLPATFARLFA